MVGRDTTVEVELRMRDLATRELRQFQKDVRRVGRTSEREFKRVDRGAKRASLSILKMAGGVAALYAAVRAGRAALTAGFGFAEAAADLEEANSKFEVFFEEAAPRASEELDKLAKALQRSRGELIDQAAGFGGLLVPMGFVEEEAADLSLSLTALAQDLSSIGNTSPEQAFIALRAGIIGSSEPLLQFGVDVRDVNVQQKALELGLKRTGQELTSYEKTVARLALISDQTVKAQGDLIRTSDSYTNQVRALQSAVKSARTEIGTFLLPVLKDAISDLGGAEAAGNDLRAAFTAVAFVTAGFVRAGVSAIKAGREIVEQFGGVNRVLKIVVEVVSFATQAFSNFINTLRLLGEVSVVAFQTLGDAALSSFANVLSAVNAVTDALNAFGDFVNIDIDLGTGFGKEIIANAKSLGEVGTEAIDGLAEAFGRYAERTGVAKSNADAFRLQLDKIRTGVIQLIEDSKLDDITPDFAEFTGKLDAALNQPLSRVIANANATKEAVREVAMEFNIFGQAAATAGAQIALFEVEQERLRSGAAGAEDAIAAYGETLSNNQLAFDATTGIFGAFESGISNLSAALVEGEADFGEFAKGIIKNVGQIIIQFLLLKSIRGALGFDAAGGATGGGLGGLLGGAFAKGGVMPGQMGNPIPFNAYASGGVATGPQLALFGEGRGAEAFVPLPDGKNIPVKMEGGGGGNPVTIQIQAIDTQSGMEFLNRNAQQIATNVANAIEANTNRKLVKAVGRA